ncbi:MAG: GAF domain-containing protein [Fimbriimonadaceae bacterium]|nr:GAF domain-containing protein [Fimbriimonadaceae bacterium]QYK55109.1 MAG: GAF domain-containing protein [Fimbriimonadaceae bacterium]
MANAKASSPPLAEALAGATSEAVALALAVEWARERFGADSCDLLEAVPGGGLVLTASTHLTELVGRVRVGRNVGLVGRALESGRKQTVSHGLTDDDRFAAIPTVDEPAYNSGIAVPLRAGETKLGVIFLRRAGSWVPTPAESRRLDEAASQLGLAWRVWRVAHESGSHSNRLQALAEVTDMLTGTPYLEEILQHLVNLTARRFNYGVVSLRLLDPARNELVLRAAYSLHRAYPRRPVVNLDESIHGRVIKRGRPVVVEDVAAEPSFAGQDLALEHGLRSMVAVPLKLHNRTVGVMSCYAAQVREFPSDEVAILETIAKQAAVSIEHAKLQVRDTLMQEMHHRVKNNLQQVASLLRIQARQSHYRTLEEALHDTLGRIEAIASVHDLLSREDLDHVSILSIAEALVLAQQRSFVRPDRQIEFCVRGVDVHLDTMQATQISLILNELVQNAVIHGFNKTTSGEIHVTIEQEQDTVHVWVSNNGDPLPDQFDPKKSRLGLQIVEGLSRSLLGSFTMEEKLGWTIGNVSFPRTAGA